MKFGVSNEAGTIDSAEVPYLEELLDYLPIDATDKEDVNTYFKNITDSILVNYGNGQYQFAYFGLHLLYMTYVYCTVWKISRLMPKECDCASVFAKAYGNGDFNFCDIESIFDYSKVPEKEIAKIFKLIEFDPGQLGKISDLVDERNEMAHASGKIEILTDDVFYIKANTMWDSVKNIHNCMNKLIRRWFKAFLLRYCDKGFPDYKEIKDIIEEQMIQSFNLSVNELLVCSEMSVSDMITENRHLGKKLKEFKKCLKDYCEEHGYIYT